MFRFNRPLSLRQFVSQYAQERGLSPNSVRALGYVVNSFERFLGQQAALSHCNRERVNAWIARELADGLDPETVRNRRTVILGLWKHAYEQRLLKHAPERIAKVKVPRKIPNAWHLTQLAQLIREAQSLAGEMNSDRLVRRADFWCAYWRADYDLGVRLGDLLRLTAESILADGTTLMVQSKTNVVLRGRLRPETLAMIPLLRPQSDAPIFGRLVNHSNAQKYVRKLVRAAGLPGSTKWIRRTGATWIEVHQPGAAPAYLGHSDRRTAYRSYVDPRYVQENKPLPPEIT